LSPGSGGRVSPFTEELEGVWITGVEDTRGGTMGFWVVSEPGTQGGNEGRAFSDRLGDVRAVVD